MTEEIRNCDIAEIDYMNECYCCGFWNSDYEACTCPLQDKWYACPIESKKPENQKALEEYAEWTDRGEKV